MSVMNGFRSELIDKIVGFNPHAVVKPYGKPIDLNVLKNKDLIKISKTFMISNNSEGVLINKDYTKGLLLRGYLKKDFAKLDIVKSSKFIGNEKLNEKFISIGKVLSIDYDINIGDKLLIMSPSGEETILGNLPKQETYLVDSIFDSEIAEFDRTVAFINLNNLENLFDLKKENRNLEIYLKNPIKSVCRSGGIGRHAWFRVMCPNGCGSSSLPYGTIKPYTAKSNKSVSS